MIESVFKDSDTMIVFSVVALSVVISIVNFIRNKRKGKSPCSDCTHCSFNK